MWEFPREHWDALREGSKMNFVSPSPGKIHPKSDMDDDRRRVAAEFIDELCGLGVLVKADADHPVHTTAYSAFRL